MATKASPDNLKIWRKLSDIVEQIAATEADIKATGGEIVMDPGDIEALNILKRIERKIGNHKGRATPSPWDHPDWKAAARESLEQSIANSPPPILGARNFWEACRMVDARNAKRQASEPEPKPKFAPSTIDATKWLRKFHPDRLPAWYAKHPGLQKHMEG